MFAYLLLRNNKQSGPYTLDELKSFGIRPTDLLWIEGRSTAWHFADEIEELQAYVHVSPVSSRHSSNGGIDIEHKEEADKSFRFENKNEKRSALPIEKKPKPEKGRAGENEQISKLNIEMRKNILGRKEPENISPEQSFSDKNLQKNSYNFSAINSIKVIIADDHRLFREGVKTALAQKNDVRIIGEAENGMQLLNLLKHNRPDVILLDIQMPVMDGISALTSIRKLHADMKVIILSMHEGHSMVSTLMETGANGYLTKMADPESIYQAIKTCHEKNYYFNELTNVSMLEGLRSKKRIPEKIISNEFNGAELMQRLATAQKQSGNYSSPINPKQILIGIFSLLLIGAGVIAAMTMMGGEAKPPASTTKPTNIPVVTNPQPLIVPPSQVDTAKKIAADSLQKNIPADSIAAEKNELLTETKKDASDKHINKKTKDTIKVQPLALVQKPDSFSKKDNEVPAKQASSPASEAKANARNSIHSLITASANNYHVGAFGGLSDIEITVENRSTYNLDEVTVEVQYILSNGKLHKTETLNFQNIQPSSSLVLKAPKNSRGAKIEYRVISVKSKELDL
ncbi:MAG TPA: response regulator [Puia sp.]|nr:response regulator [Puia sp.]